MEWPGLKMSKKWSDASSFKVTIAFLDKWVLESGSNSRVHLTTEVLDPVDPTTLATPVSPMYL
jgi:hypothetical protein